MAGDNSGPGWPSGRRGTLATASCLAMAVVLIALALLAQSRRLATVDFSVQAQAPGRLQVFHDGRGQFGELGAYWFHVGPQPSTVRIQAAGRTLRHLRFDPPAGMAMRLCGPRIAGAAGREVTLAKDVTAQPDGDCLWLRPRAGAQDPQWSMVFTGQAEQRLQQARHWQHVYGAALVGATLLLAWLAWTARAAMQRRLDALRASQRLQGLERCLHWLLAALMLALGGAYVVATPPGAVADEEAHLAKAVRVAHGIPFGGSGDVRLPNPRQMYGPFSDYLTNKAAFARPQLEHQLARPLACERSTTALAVGANGYFPHQYLLPALAFRASCALHSSFGTFLYLSRLLNLLLATALVAWGVKHAQRGKWGLFAVALLPMSLFQMASLSADSLTLSLSLAWLGLVSGVAGGTLDPRRARWALGAVALGVALLKPGTAWILVCLVFCRAAYCEAGLSFPRALVAFVLLPWAVHVAWTLAASAEAPAFVGVDPRANVQHLLAHPLSFPATLARTLTGHHALMVLQRMIGVLGWLDVFLSGWAYVAGTVALLAAAGCGRDAVLAPTRGTVPFALLCAAGSLALIALPLFVLWTPIGSPIVLGLQGRYYLPTLAFVLAWCAWRSPPQLRAMLVLVVVGALVAINVDALGALDRAYFVNGR